MDDNALLRRYAEEHSDEAFAALVARHINLVYSVALRQTGNPHQAEEITQAVFIILAKKAASMSGTAALSSWLFQTTRWTAGNFIRSESRRHHREQEAHVQSILNEPGHDIWPQIAPMLDAAVAALGEKDRRAIVLRFYEGRNLREVGQALGASEDAAEKRVARAVEKLQHFFSKRGIHSTTAALEGTISSYSVQVAPALLVKSVTAAALAEGAAKSGSILSLAKATFTALQAKAIAVTIAAMLVAGAGGYFWTHAHQQSATPARPQLAVVGVGLYVARNTHTRKFEVRRVFPNSPAEKAGLVPGLILNKVDNVLAETKNIKDLSKMLMGPEDSKVTLEMTDTNGETIQVALLREQFVNHSTPRH